MSCRATWSRLLPLALVMGTIFFLSHQPGNSLSLPDIVNIDKVLHALVYAALGLAFLFALSPAWRRRRPVAAVCATVCFCLMYGISDEFHQSFISGRFSSGADLVADAAGGVVAAVSHWQWRRRQVQGGRQEAR